MKPGAGAQVRYQWSQWVISETGPRLAGLKSVPLV